MMRCVIVDDEEKNRNLLAELVKKNCAGIEIVGLANDGFSGTKMIRELKPELVFLDIQMPRMSGLQMLELYGDIDFEVIFVTAYDQYAIKAIQFSAFDYLLKPVDPEDLIASIERLKQKKLKQDSLLKTQQLLSNLHQPAKKISKITLHNYDGVHIIPITDIIYLQADGQYTHF